MSTEQLDSLVQRVVNKAGLDRTVNIPVEEFVPALTNLMAGISLRLGTSARTLNAEL